MKKNHLLLRTLLTITLGNNCFASSRNFSNEDPLKTSLPAHTKQLAALLCDNLEKVASIIEDAARDASLLPVPSQEAVLTTTSSQDIILPTATEKFVKNFKDKLLKTASVLKQQTISIKRETLLWGSVEQVSKHALGLWAFNLPLLRFYDNYKERADKLFSSAPPITLRYFENIQQTINYLCDFPQEFFSPTEKLISSYVQFTCIDTKKEIYETTISEAAIRQDIIKNGKNIKNLLEKIQVDKFNLPNPLKKQLKSLLSTYIEHYKMYETLKRIQNKGTVVSKKQHFLDRETGDMGLKIPHALIQTRIYQNDTYNTLHNLFGTGEIKVEEKLYKLSPEQLKENYSKLNEMLHSSLSVQEKPVQEKNVEKPQPFTKKKKKGKQKKNSLQPTVLTPSLPQEVNTVNTSASVSQENKEISSLETTTSSTLTSISISEGEKVIISPSLTQVSSKDDNILIMHTSSAEDILKDTKKSLQEIMSQCQYNDNFYSLYIKARSLYKELERHNGEEVIFSVLEGTTNLLQKFQAMQVKNTSIIPATSTPSIGKNIEDDLRHFMTTPIKYLNQNIRLSFFERIFNNLGGKIVKEAEGSRIKFHLNNQTTTLHLHNSINGILDGGRIMGLRKLLISAGVLLKEDSE